ncbi:serpin family protein [Cohnella sp. WQ 127256]|uniref:serpin family protein n=1 Tax=Cohnella sp. WQ 127256 TaxID=2938790 RepID=UPI00211889DA|nr:serpin family protein [Cohnella sp. WQ 127256]
MKKIVNLLVIFTAFVCSSCQNGNTVESVEHQREYTLADLDTRIVEASNRFGLTLFSELSKQKSDDNVFISPLSISSALSLVNEGATGETTKALMKTLELGTMSKEEVGQGYRMLLDLLRSSEDRDVELNVANSIWMREGQKFHEAFVQRSRTSYHAETNQLDFNSPSAVKKMNNWVDQQTNGKIKEMVKVIHARSILYVLNAVYFKGAWSQPFQPQATSEGKFHVPDSEAVSIELMSKSGHFEYTKQPEYEAIRIPFGKKESASMVIFLPEAAEGSVNQVLQKLTADSELITKPFELRQGRVDLPKVKFDYSISLNDALQAMGMGEAFDEVRADFSLMAPQPPNIFISKVDHKTTLEINEQGTEAAAATKVEMLAGSSEPSDPFHMTIDRPFIVAIVDQVTNSILFIGTVVNPNPKHIG